VFFITLGCAKNEVDTDRMRALLFASGFTEVDTPEAADVCLINTCSFLASATSESIEATLELAEERAAHVRELPLIMCGCVPSRYGDSLPAELPEVAAFVKTTEEDNIVAVVREALGLEPAGKSQPGALLGSAKKNQGGAAAPVLRTVEATSAYVKISDGCDRFCSFCAIPYIRGRYQSRPQVEIEAEVQALLEGGVREIVLIGQDTGIWGEDFAEPQTLASLLRALAPLAGAYGAWIRVLYLQPEGMTPELIATIRDLPEVLPYIDIPIQHVNGRVLTAMRRTGDVESLTALFAHLREEIPHMVVRTTGLVGFPGETEEEFDELCDFIEREQFDYVSVFAYSQEDGTKAATLEGQIDEAIKLEREQVLHDIAEELGFASTRSHVGETVDVIIDGIEEGEQGVEFIGHAWFQAPDCDGAVHIPEGDFAIGDVVRCQLVDAFCYELIGEVVA
jgi:ribosomal protein S12 methylthiotransferase